MTYNENKIVLEFLKRVGSKGGLARAKKYNKATLRKWAKKGGRPRGTQNNKER